MRAGITLLDKRIHGKGSQQVWLFKSRKPAVAKFVALAMAQEQENRAMRQEHAATLARARKGDMAAVLALGDF
jgi:hypothetical protein